MMFGESKMGGTKKLVLTLLPVLAIWCIHLWRRLSPKLDQHCDRKKEVMIFTEALYCLRRSTHI